MRYPPISFVLVATSTPPPVLGSLYSYSTHFRPSVHQHFSFEVGDLHPFYQLPIQRLVVAVHHLHCVVDILTTLFVNLVTHILSRTAVCAGIYGLSVSMGNQFSIGYLAMFGPIFMIPTADSMISTKNHPPSTCVYACVQFRIACILSITRIANFGQFRPKFAPVVGVCDGDFFL